MPRIPKVVKKQASGASSKRVVAGAEPDVVQMIDVDAECDADAVKTTTDEKAKGEELAKLPKWQRPISSFFAPRAETASQVKPTVQAEPIEKKVEAPAPPETSQAARIDAILQSHVLIEDEDEEEEHGSSPSDVPANSKFPQEKVDDLAQVIALQCASGAPVKMIVDAFDLAVGKEVVSNRATRLQLLFMAQNRDLGDADKTKRWWLRPRFWKRLDAEIVSKFKDAYASDLEARAKKKEKKKRKPKAQVPADLSPTGKKQKAGASSAAMPVTEHEDKELTTKDDPRIGVNQAHLDAWLAEAKAVVEEEEAEVVAAPTAKIPALTDLDSLEAASFLSRLAQSRTCTLTQLTKLARQALAQFSEEALAQKLPILVERKCYGIRRKTALSNSDCEPDSLWRWESANLELLLPQDRKRVQEKRRRLTALSKRINTTNRLLGSLRNNFEGKLETKVARDHEALEKYLREDAAQRLKDEARQQKLQTKEEEAKRKLEEKKRKMEEKKRKSKEGCDSASSVALSSTARPPITASLPAAAALASAEATAREMDQAFESGAAPFTLSELVDSMRVKRKAFPLPRGRSGTLEPQVPRQTLDEVAVANLSRKKLLQFGENRRPPYFGTFRKVATNVRGRNPFVKEPSLDYDIYSDAEWQSEPDDGESVAESHGNNSEDGGDGEEELDYQDGWLLEDDVVEYNSDVQSSGEDDQDQDDQGVEGEDVAAKAKKGKRLKRVASRQGSFPTGARERYAVGVLFDAKIIESAKEGAAAYNLKRYSVDVLPSAERFTQVQDPLPCIALDDIKCELLTKTQKRKLERAKTPPPPASPAPKRAPSSPSVGGAGPATATTAVAGSPTPSGKTLDSATTADHSAATPKKRAKAETLPFPAKYEDCLVDMVDGSEAQIKQLADDAQVMLSKEIAVRFAKDGAKGKLDKPPSKKVIKAHISAIATREKRQGDTKSRWVVNRALLLSAAKPVPPVSQPPAPSPASTTPPRPAHMSTKSPSPKSKSPAASKGSTPTQKTLSSFLQIKSK
ncbi:Chromatin assembly factor 1 subunit A (CAF-1 subunit A) (Chromatin assembly factor I p150 subunit) (CAF-I 150 kDa subunit) (CAF-I p150) [Durusdinium trenchii]|uniref:Chromatin assembly factor 1 subunit A (CAF-1 subunit A) (Chromatin assembly factor I p150 subunit) (CAF-I 150 kDa subunit) (CAF-I p150) n=1 Tax=Durusdinium trenchii TaxID=1381693 RepID=A0ABP0QTP2_9DINO